MLDVYMNMNILCINKIQSVCFSSRKLFDVKLRRSVDYEPFQEIDANIIELDENDLDRFDLQEDYWENDDIGKSIIKDIAKRKKYIKFLPNYWGKMHFYGIETNVPDEENYIVSLAEVFVNKDKINLVFLQSLKQIDILKVIKGGGSCLLYAVQQLAESLKKPQIALTSEEAATDFYSKNGFLNLYGRDYVLPENKFEEFKRRLEEKYSITPVL